MPKFLDAPSWYNSQGTLSYGVGVDTNERPGVGDVPCVHLPSGELNWRNLRVNGAPSGDIDIYAPASNPTGGQVLLSSGAGEPVWQDFDVNGAAIGTRATSIYAPTLRGSSNEFLYWNSSREISSKKIYFNTGSENINSQHEIYTNSIVSDTVITISSGKYIHNVSIVHPASDTMLYISPYVTSSSTKVETFSSLLNSLRADGNSGYLGATGAHNGNIVYGFNSTGLSGNIHYIKIS